MTDGNTVQVWDPLVRIFHWSLVVGVALAFLTAEEQEEIHEAVGYIIGGLVVFRILWGFAGPKYARFSNFAYGPSAVRAYLVQLLAFRGRRYLGHSPAGGAMVIALLLLLAVTVGTGIATELQEKQAPAAVTAIGQNGEKESDSLVGGIHEAAANVLIVFVGLHIAGVLLASFVHRENLVSSMFTGRKRPTTE